MKEAMLMVSSKDVAKYAGVSQTTVSRVLNTPELVKAATVEKVTKAIEALNYIPNENARLLVQNRTNTIALLSGPLHNPFFVDTTMAIVNYANSQGYKVDVQFVNDEKITQAYARFLERKVDGLILSCIFMDDPFFHQLENLNIPFTTYNRKHNQQRFFVEIDNEQAGYLAAKHLLELGHKKIAWIGGSQEVSTYANRFLGVQRAFKEANIPLTSAYIYHTDTLKQTIEQTVMTILALPDPPTALIGGADSIALMLMDICLEKKIAIPEDISIIGIDNVELAKHHSIQLTTVGDCDESNLGLIAIQKLIENIENKKKSCIEITKSVSLFLRDTTAAVR